jgi:hypothetical protein
MLFTGGLAERSVQIGGSHYGETDDIASQSLWWTSRGAGFSTRTILALGLGDASR